MSTHENHEPEPAVVPSVRAEHLTTSGTFSLDGHTFDVENNVWLVGDDEEVLVVDAPHDVDAIVEAVAGRRVVGIVATHAHDDHVRFAPELAERLDTSIWLHPADRELWEMTHGNDVPTKDLVDRQILTVAGSDLYVLHTPGHSPGSVSLFSPDLAAVFSGDTLFAGGPGATGRSFSDFPTIIVSIRTRLLTLPDGTRVNPGHGPSTTVDAEAPHLQEWIARGH
ncbi:MBL fold metallo-hydrolase [Sanguibacter antarcticus]|uniref:Glyoxylase-like metal-dependent hydrolase (Beta-lactamase superfamily II) n=1 Tax=Sanguibacter antarcticus TaxID=372484 RepID=A0A2A9E5D9_9MICO|nr:MBL fold metallo-hydrolase [Sanguibacter antarcticus]PFG34074.1 glyoxylase-like metal-dependent hydrolase (beta-lactamase superfamily II) [Sanguibacter antarcticus]